MNINNTLICTPYDTFPEYDPDWRNKVAKAWAGAQGTIVMPPNITNDIWIKGQKYYYDHLTTKVMDDKATWMNALVHGWHENGVVNNLKLCLEPMLLTEVPYTVIAADLLGTHYGEDGPKLIHLYERLFYDCRDEDGTMSDIALRRKWLAHPSDMRLGEGTPIGTQYKILATTGGYPGLMLAMILSGCHGAKPTVEYQMEMMNTIMNSTLAKRATIQTIGNMDLVMAQRNLIEFYKAQKEDDTTDARVTSLYVTLRHVLKLFMPEVYAQEIPLADQLELDTEYKNKVKSQYQLGAGQNNVNEDAFQPALAKLGDNFLSEVDKAINKGGPAVPVK